MQNTGDWQAFFFFLRDQNAKKIKMLMCLIQTDQNSAQIFNRIAFDKWQVAVSQATVLHETDDCNFGGVYIPWIYSHARWSYRRRFRSLLLCPLSVGHYHFPLLMKTVIPLISERRLKIDMLCAPNPHIFSSFFIWNKSQSVLLSIDKGSIQSINEKRS